MARSSTAFEQEVHLIGLLALLICSFLALTPLQLGLGLFFRTLSADSAAAGACEHYRVSRGEHKKRLALLATLNLVAVSCCERTTATNWSERDTVSGIKAVNKAKHATFSASATPVPSSTRPLAGSTAHNQSREHAQIEVSLYTCGAQVKRLCCDCCIYWNVHLFQTLRWPHCRPPASQTHCLRKRQPKRWEHTANKETRRQQRAQRLKDSSKHKDFKDSGKNRDGETAEKTEMKLGRQRKTQRWEEED